MNKNLLILGCVTTLLMLTGRDVIAGDLDPSGPPAPTMKTLNQVEPRTPISSLPYTITNSGSYYVTGNLESSTDGIVIDASRVTLDLMGFSLTGDGGYPDVGIHVDGEANAVIENLVIKGGRISGFYYGLACERMNNSRIEEMMVSDNLNYGVMLNRGNGNTITDCTISGNEAWGVYLYGGYAQCDGNTITDCTISGNEAWGVYLYGWLGQCVGNTIQGNTISKNTDRGIYLYYAVGNRIEANHVTETTGDPSYGIYTSVSENNFFLQNSCIGQTNNFEIGADNTFVENVPDTDDTLIMSLPYTINTPGVYYLIKNLESTGHGIVITSSGVTLDLDGFSITGDGDSSDYGIYVEGGATNVIDKLQIKSGAICGYGNGLRCKFMKNSRLEQLVVSESTSHAVLLTGNSGQCNGNTVTDCTVSGNMATGFYLDGRGAGECNGNRVVNCIVSENGGIGIQLNGEAGSCDGNILQGNQVSKNVDRGITLYKADFNRIEGNNAWGQTGASIGIRTLETSGNFILRNTCSAQTSNFDLDSDDTYGPIVTSSGALVGTDPWANFSR